jgi:hypothetical protein
VPLDVKRFAEFLTGEGYRPSVDQDRFVTFKHEGGFYYVDLDPTDRSYVRVVFPGFWKLAGPEDLQRALAAANVATLTIKTAKVVIIPDESKVSAAVELFVQTAEQLEAMLPRCLTCLQAAVRRFGEEMDRRTVDPSPPVAFVRRFGAWPPKGN